MERMWFLVIEYSLVIEFSVENVAVVSIEDIHGRHKQKEHGPLSITAT